MSGNLSSKFVALIVCEIEQQFFGVLATFAWRKKFGELDTCGQFHQHFTCVFFVRKHIFGAEILYESAMGSFVIFGAKISATFARRKKFGEIEPVSKSAFVKTNNE